MLTPVWSLCLSCSPFSFLLLLHTLPLPFLFCCDENSIATGEPRALLIELIETVTPLFYQNINIENFKWKIKMIQMKLKGIDYCQNIFNHDWGTRTYGTSINKDSVFRELRHHQTWDVLWEVLLLFSVTSVTSPPPCAIPLNLPLSHQLVQPISHHLTL